MPSLGAEYSGGGVACLPQTSGKWAKKEAGRASAKVTTTAETHIVDIRCHAIELDLKDEIISMLKPAKGPKKLPTLLLYDDVGLQLFEKITYLDEYYLTNAEIDVLTNWSRQIAQYIRPGAMIVELGSGSVVVSPITHRRGPLIANFMASNLRKVKILLDVLEANGKDVDYYALDLSLTELERTLAAVPRYQYVRCHGLHGTYDDGLAWLKSTEIASRPKFILSLGSSIGNFSRREAASFLKEFAQVLNPCDGIIVGLDACDDPAKVFHAYNDCEGVTHNFLLNGLEHANNILNEKVFDVTDWNIIGEYVYDAEIGRHQAFYTPNRDVMCVGIHIEEGERVQVEQSLKYSASESKALWKTAGLEEVGNWSASTEPYNIHLLTKRDMPFPLDPSQYAKSTVPSLEDWRELWVAWDTVTRGMIPEDELFNKPIQLRNACIFYLGHIPTFLDINLSRATGQSLCEPFTYPKIFERGIDPDVENPDHCHDHSEIPEEWPPLAEVLEYQNRVRTKVKQTYDRLGSVIPRKIGRSLWVGFEHEIMHLETLLYMLLQSDKTLPPPQTVKPDFKKDAEIADSRAVPNQWFTIPEQEIRIGLEDPEDNTGPGRHFGWDNEKPPRKVRVQSFQAQGRPITNEEYAIYLEATCSTKLPASWTGGNLKDVEVKARINGYSGSSNGIVNGHLNGTTNADANGHQNCAGRDPAPLKNARYEGVTVRTFYGPVPLNYALQWPVFGSYDELARCAAWMGGRIPTAEEARSIYSHVDGLKLKEAEQQLGKTVPAVNGHLLNDGVQETPPSRPSTFAKGSPELFNDLQDANVGFRNWHPIAVTGNGNKLAGQGELGGIWEWTSSILAPHEGFQPMPSYPNYTADFFDGKHNIVLGGSWATHPRIAGRKTFVNWYQRNYPYAWAGARLVRDL